MSNKVLIITNNLDGDILQQIGADKFADQNYEILTLGFIGVRYEKQNQQALQNNLKQYSYIDLGAYYKEAQAVTREYCLRVKYELPRKAIYRKKTLFDLMDTPHFNLWWFTGLSEMGSFRTKFVDQIYALTLIQSILKNGYEFIYLDITDSRLNQVVEGYLDKHRQNYLAIKHKINDLKNVLKQKFLLWWMISVSVFVFRQILKTTIIHILRIGYRLESHAHNLLFFSFYPSLWAKKKNGTYSNKIFNEIVPSIDPKYPSFDLILTTSLKSFFKGIIKDRYIFLKQKIIMLERYLPYHRIVWLFSFNYLQLILKYHFQFAQQINEHYGDFDISVLIRNALNVSLSDAELYRDVHIYFALNNLVNKIRIHGVVHASEFQCYEKAIWYAGGDKCTTYAFQHSAIGKNWLNYYFMPEDIPASLSSNDLKQVMPLPDMYITSGTYPHRVMQKNNLPEDRLKLCGALRYNHLAAYLEIREDREVLRRKNGVLLDRKVMLILTSVNESESYDMAQNIFDALRDTEEDIDIFYKAHPLQILDDKIKDLHERAGINHEFHILPVQANYFEFISLADVTCFCNSTIGIESIALGTPSISFDNYHSITSYDIIEVGDAVFHVTSAADIGEALKSIFAEDSKLKKIKRLWPQAIEDTFYKLDGKSNARFIQHISKQINGGG